MAGSVSPAEIRLVLLGSVDEGKRSAGNTILGRELFGSQKTAECVTKHGYVGPRQVAVINTPGWGREQRLSQTPQNVREQLLRSVFPPGVHALILVIRADRKFTEANRVSLQDHMELLGERVWDHTIVLFTCVDWLGGVPIEQFIYSEGMPLQWVVEKSSYKYYCIDNTYKADITQVSTLLELIEMMVAGNGCHFELDKVIYEREKERAEAQEKAIQEMRQKALEMRKSWGAQPTRHQSPLLNPPDMSGGTRSSLSAGGHGANSMQSAHDMEIKMETSAEEPGANLMQSHTLSSYHYQSPKLVPSYDQHSCSPGDDLILLCHFSSKTNAVAMEVRWFKGTDCIHLYKDGQVREGRGYEGRVSLNKGKLRKGSINLTLRNIQQNDAGNYACQVLHEGSCDECAFRINYSPYAVDGGRLITDEDRMKMEASTPGLEIDSSVGCNTDLST